MISTTSQSKLEFGKDILLEKRVSCEICRSDETYTIFRQADVPVFCNILYDTPQEAVDAPRGGIRLVQCDNCGYIFNSEFEQDKLGYSRRYENALHHSPVFQKYADQLAGMLVDNFQLRSKRVLEIGCGDGDFLRRLRNFGAGECSGYDPSCRSESFDGIKLIPKFFDPEQHGADYDLLCMRQVLEHIDDPGGFLRLLANSMKSMPQSLLFIEVPSAEASFRRDLIWDILYEHKSYFTAPFLDYLLKLCGFDVLANWPSFAGQYWCFVARPNLTPHPPVATRRGLLCERFNARYRTRIKIYRHCMRLLSRHQQKAVVWGGGTKGVNFVNAMEQDNSVIEGIVDINSYKQGKYIPISAKPILSPGRLKTVKPDIVIVMNENYKQEIIASLNKLKIQASLLLA